MNIIIVGGGKVGTTLTELLAKEGHNVTIIDTAPKLVESIVNNQDVIGFCGNGASFPVQSEAGVERCDVFIAVTGSDELNIMSCLVAEKLGAKHSVARVRNPEYSGQMDFLRDKLEIDLVVNPDLEAANEIARAVEFPAASKVETFAKGRVELAEIKITDESPLANLALFDLKKVVRAPMLVCAVQRGEEVIIPSGNFALRGGDKIGVTANQTEIIKFLKELNLIQKQTKNVTILGGSRIAFYLAKRLLASGNDVKIIEQNLERCEEISELLPAVTVIHADGTQQEVLLEEGIENTDAFVALTGIDEENILISFFAQRKNVPKVITKVNREELQEIADDMGIDCIVSPKKIIADILTRYARALKNSMGSKIETLYRLMDSNVEALEFKVSPDFVGVQTPLKNLSLKDQILIAGIIRGRTAIIPAGEDVILPGDRVIVIAGQKKLQDLSDIMR